MNKKEINYKGKKLITSFVAELSDDEFNQLRTDYYKKPSFKDVKNQFVKIYNGGTKNNDITNYYVKDLMAKTLIYYNKWSIEDVFDYKPLLEFFYARTLSNEKVFPPTYDKIKNIETAFRLAGKGVASKPSNFPMKTVDKIINKYNKNNNYYDYSCGWGVRLTSAIKNKVNYFGTDPNYLLTERLNQLANDFMNTIGVNLNVDIKSQGSEIFVPEWENKMGLSFSSPPYFNLEDYKVGKQSYTDGTTYDEWINNYFKPTIANIYKYLINDGYFIININNIGKNNLIKDTMDIAISNNFKYLCNEQLVNINRCFGAIGKPNECGFNDNSETIMVFTK